MSRKQIHCYKFAVCQFLLFASIGIMACSEQGIVGGTQKEATSGSHSLEVVEESDFDELYGKYGHPYILKEEGGEDDWMPVACRYQDDIYTDDAILYAWRNGRPVLMRQIVGDARTAPDRLRKCTIGSFKRGKDDFVILDPRQDGDQIAENIINWGTNLNQLRPYIVKLIKGEGVDKNTVRVLTKLAEGELWIGDSQNSFVRQIQMPPRTRFRIAFVLWRYSDYKRSEWLIDRMRECSRLLHSPESPYTRETYRVWDDAVFRSETRGHKYAMRHVIGDGNYIISSRLKNGLPSMITPGLIEGLGKVYRESFKHKFDKSYLKQDIEALLKNPKLMNSVPIWIAAVKHLNQFDPHNNTQTLIPITSSAKPKEMTELATVMIDQFVSRFKDSDDKSAYKQARGASIAFVLATIPFKSAADVEKTKQRYTGKDAHRIYKFIEKWHRSYRKTTNNRHLPPKLTE